jgi:hypothetical protein
MINNDDYKDLKENLDNISNIKDDMVSEIENMIYKIETIVKKFDENYKLTKDLEDLKDILSNVDLDDSLDFINNLSNNLENLFYKYRMDKQNNQLIYNPRQNWITNQK